MTNDIPRPTNPDQDGTGPVCERAYPVVRGHGIDYRFTDGLLSDVAEVLAAHGYPVIETDSGDYEELGWALWRFIYGRPTR